jgi:hypothetical protein
LQPTAGLHTYIVKLAGTGPSFEMYADASYLTHVVVELL